MTKEKTGWSENFGFWGLGFGFWGFTFFKKLFPIFFVD